MTEFRMTVGLPFSGISEYAKYLSVCGYRLFDADGLSSEKEKEKQCGDIIRALESGVNCVYEGCNLGRRRRRHFLERVRKTGVKTVCDLFVVPVPVLRDRMKETGVCEPDVYDMLKNFECPYLNEGFDIVAVHLYAGPCNLEYSREDLMSMPQDNPNHSLTTGEHEDRAAEYINRNYPYTHCRLFPAAAARYHDDGKYFSKTFLDSRGNVSHAAHYYGHENIGSYLFLLRGYCLKQFAGGDEYRLDGIGILYTAYLISLHMRPMHAWMLSEKAEKRDRRMLGEEICGDLRILGEADRYGH